MHCGSLECTEKGLSLGSKCLLNMVFYRKRGLQQVNFAGDVLMNYLCLVEGRLEAYLGSDLTCMLLVLYFFFMRTT